MTELMGERGRQGAAPLGGYTPGPWWYDPEDNWVGSVSDDDRRDWQEYICRVEDGNLANAHLIAAAPELLALIEKWLETGIDRAEAFAIIAKARGEQ